MFKNIYYKKKYCISINIYNNMHSVLIKNKRYFAETLYGIKKIINEKAENKKI